MIAQHDSMSIDTLRSVTHGDDDAIRAQHGIGTQMRLDLFERVFANLPTELASGFLIKKDDRSSLVVMGLATKVEQLLNNKRRNATLLKAGLSMVSHGYMMCFLIGVDDKYHVTASKAH